MEEEYRAVMLAAEIDFVRRLVHDADAGTLEGAAWWRAVHEGDPDAAGPPFDVEAFHDLRVRGE